MEVKVTQADRDAAADFYRDCMAKPGEWFFEQHLREGGVDGEGIIQSYTRHRISSQTELIEALENLLPHVTLEVECRKHGGSGEDYAELEALEHAAQEAVRKAKGA